MMVHVVNLNSNKLSEWRCLEDKGELEQVKELHVSFNYLSEVPQSLIHRLSGLRCLALCCNNLTSIPCLEGMTSLTHLQLSNNRITVIENLQHLPLLEELNLRCNKIKILEKLTENTALHWLSVSGNEINSFDWDTLPQLPILNFLGIYSNQLNNFEDVLHLLSLTPALTELFVGCNPCTMHQPISVEMQCLLNFPNLQANTLSSLTSEILQQQQLQQKHEQKQKMAPLYQAVQMQCRIKKLCAKLVKIDGDQCVTPCDQLMSVV